MTGARPFIVKICGITSPEDARLAAAAGADAIGVNLWPGSKRFVDEARARDVLGAVPTGVLKVGVFVNAPATEVAARVAALGLDRAQLHGDEAPRAFTALDAARLIRVVRVRDERSFASADGWDVPLFLYDALVDGYGGGGVTAPWPLIARLGRRPLWLAGGLTPDNVAAAIAAVRPDGVDVASGVESAPRHKDAARLRTFVTAARAAASAMYILPTP
jgi:phosphoribosylanthranilate isomerase